MVKQLSAYSEFYKILGNVSYQTPSNVLCRFNKWDSSVIYQKLLLKVTLEIRISPCHREILGRGTEYLYEGFNDHLPLLVGWWGKGIKGSAQ
jgi:hypothetical protein